MSSSMRADVVLTRPSTRFCSNGGCDGCRVKKESLVAPQTIHPLFVFDLPYHVLALCLTSNASWCSLERASKRMALLIHRQEMRCCLSLTFLHEKNDDYASEQEHQQSEDGPNPA